MKYPRCNNSMHYVCTLIRFAIFLLSISGCGILDNKYDAVAFHCSESRPDQHIAIKILSTTAEVLDGETIEARLIDEGSSEEIKVSELGCIFIPATVLNTPAIDIAVRHIDRKSALTLQSDRLSKLYSEVKLEENPEQFLSGSPKPDCLSSYRPDAKSAFALVVEEKQELSFYQVKAKFSKPLANIADRTLVKNAADFDTIPLPTFNTSLDGTYAIEVKVFDAFNPAKETAETCKLDIDTQVPSVAVRRATAHPRLIAIEDSPFYLPKMPINFEILDNSAVRIHYCLVEGHKDDSQCEATFRPADGDIKAPESGKWTLLYFGEDAAGWRTEITPYRFIVVHDSTMEQIANRSARTELSLQSFQLNLSYSQIFQSLWDYIYLPLREEREGVNDLIQQAVNRINQHTPEVFRTDLDLGFYSSVEYAPNGYLLGCIKSEQLVDIFDSQFRLVASLPSIEKILFSSNDYFIAARSSDHLLEVYSYDGMLLGDTQLSYSFQSINNSKNHFVNIISGEVTIRDQFGNVIGNRILEAEENEKISLLDISSSGKNALLRRKDDSNGITRIEVYDIYDRELIASRIIPSPCILLAGAIVDDQNQVVLALDEWGLSGKFSPLFTRQKPINSEHATEFSAANDYRQICGVTTWDMETDELKPHFVYESSYGDCPEPDLATYSDSVSKSCRPMIPIQVNKISVLESAKIFAVSHAYSSDIFYWQFGQSEGDISRTNRGAYNTLLLDMEADGRFVNKHKVAGQQVLDFYKFDKGSSGYRHTSSRQIYGFDHNIEHASLHPEKDLVAVVDGNGQVRVLDFQPSINLQYHHTDIEPCLAESSYLWTYDEPTNNLTKLSLNDDKTTAIFPVVGTLSHCGADPTTGRVALTTYLGSQATIEGDLTLLDKSGNVLARSVGTGSLKDSGWYSEHDWQIKVRGDFIFIWDKKDNTVIYRKEGFDLKPLHFELNDRRLTSIGNSGLNLITTTRFAEGQAGTVIAEHWQWTGHKFELQAEDELSLNSNQVASHEQWQLINRFDEMMLPVADTLVFKSIDSGDSTVHVIPSPVPTENITILHWDFNGRDIILTAIDNRVIRINRQGEILTTVDLSNRYLDRLDFLDYGLVGIMEHGKDEYKVLNGQGKTVSTYAYSADNYRQTIHVSGDGRSVVVDGRTHHVHSTVFKIRTFEEEVQTLCENTRPTWALGQVDWAEAATEVCSRFTSSSDQ